MEFYASLQKAVDARDVPQVETSMVAHQESGLGSPKREYLRMHRGRNAFDVCAAPFGNGFFVSWWFTEPPLKYGFLYMLVFFLCLMAGFSILGWVGFGVGATTGYGLAVFFGGVGSFIGTPLLLWVLGDGVRRGTIGNERTLLAIPIVGWLYEWIFAPETFYAMDTAIMFQTAVHNAVLEVVDCMTAAKGIRALTEEERKPIMKRFTASA